MSFTLANHSAEVLLQSAADEFDFSSNYAEDALDEALPERIDFDAIPIDPEHPGFASFLPVLLGVSQGQTSLDVLGAYIEGLTPRLEDARDQLQNLQVPEAVREQVAPALAATSMVLEEMGVVLDLADHFLMDGVTESLHEAIERLARIHAELKNAL